jgi:hypothetical protein
MFQFIAIMTIVYFMIHSIHRLRVFSALPDFLDLPFNSNLIKQNTTLLHEWLPHLQMEGFDGWFTSIENRSAVEFAIRSDPSILKIVECSPNQLDWRNSNYRRGVFIPKSWGTVYSISTLEMRLMRCSI